MFKNKIFPRNYDALFEALVTQGTIDKASYDKVHPILDWSVLDNCLATGEMTYKQYDAVFSAMHDNIFAYDIAERRLGRKLPLGFILPGLFDIPANSGWPFFVSPSAFSVITQRNPWQTATEYFDQKMGYYAPRYVKESQQQLFDDGHDFEEAYAHAFARKSGLLWVPSPYTFWNEDYPNILYNTDGWVIEKDANGKLHLGLYEGKKTSMFSETQKSFQRGEVPTYYQDQLAGYFAGLPFLEFAYINCGWGTNTGKEMRYIRVDRNEYYINEVMDIVLSFIDDSKAGVRPILDSITHPSAIQNSAQRIYGNGNPSLPPVIIPAAEDAKFARLTFLDEETKRITLQKENLLTKLKPDLDSIEKKLKEIEKEKTQILSTLYEVIGKATEGIYKMGSLTYRVSLPPTDSFSFGSVQKSWLRTAHPDVWEEMMNKWQKPRKLSYSVEGNKTV